ncbi:MAG: DUF4395 domain-containing protein [Anaerolineales bacterium]
MNASSLQKVDHAALKANQMTIILLNILAFVFNLPWLALFVAVVMLLGVIRFAPGFYWVYKYVLKPAGILKPDVLEDNREPHRFAQLLGSVFMFAGAAFLFMKFSALGWAFVWLVIALAALNAFGGFCAGCAVYYWLGRMRVSGFIKQPPAGTFPGMRPKGADNES